MRLVFPQPVLKLLAQILDVAIEYEYVDRRILRGASGGESRLPSRSEHGSSPSSF
jgi:hypothetical protein